VKISLIHPTMYYLGGAERVVYIFAEKLSQRGHSVEIVSLKFDNAWKEMAKDSKIVFKEAGYAPSRASFFLGIELFSKSLSKLIDKDTEILCPHNFPATLAVAKFKQNIKLDTPAVWYCEEPFRFYYDQEFLRATFPHYRLVFTLSRLLYSQHDKVAVRNYNDLILTNSKFTLERVKEVYGAPGRVIHLATDPQRFRPDVTVPDRIRMIREGVDWLLFAPVRRLTFPKNVIRLVFVAKKLVDSGYRFRMIITGKGYLEGRLRKMINKLGLTKYIILCYIPEEELSYYYAISDIVVYTSLNEPFGLAVVEAMASGTAPVVANVGGPSETVVDGVTGIHVNPYDIPSIFKGITTMLCRKDLKEMGQQGRKRVLEIFTWKRTINEYERFLLTTAGLGDKQCE
jgi:glycosyltransferase involved in cell wall biosynthesis